MRTRVTIHLNQKWSLRLGVARYLELVLGATETADRLNGSGQCSIKDLCCWLCSTRLLHCRVLGPDGILCRKRLSLPRLITHSKLNTRNLHYDHLEPHSRGGCSTTGPAGQIYSSSAGVVVYKEAHLCSLSVLRPASCLTSTTRSPVSKPISHRPPVRLEVSGLPLLQRSQALPLRHLKHQHRVSKISNENDLSRPMSSSPSQQTPVRGRI